MSEWKDFKTAPKDGTAFLACEPGYEWPEVIRWYSYDAETAKEMGEAGYFPLRRGYHARPVRYPRRPYVVDAFAGDAQMTHPAFALAMVLCTGPSIGFAVLWWMATDTASRLDAALAMNKNLARALAQADVDALNPYASTPEGFEKSVHMAIDVWQAMMEQALK